MQLSGKNLSEVDLAREPRDGVKDFEQALITFARGQKSYLIQNWRRLKAGKPILEFYEIRLADKRPS